MSVHVVSLMWGDAWERYGRRFYETFTAFWPEAVDLHIVMDRTLPAPRAIQRKLSDSEGYWRFRRENEGTDRAEGRVHARKLDRNGVSWRHDAMKWFPQALAPREICNLCADGDILVWFDADVHTISSVPEDWPAELLDGADVACLQRPGTHSEIGFYAIRVGPETRAFVDEFADLYVSGRIFQFREWHSAFVFDRALAASPDLSIKNLNPLGFKGHVWPDTALARHTVHKKGKRKDA